MFYTGRDGVRDRWQLASGTDTRFGGATPRKSQAMLPGWNSGTARLVLTFSTLVGAISCSPSATTPAGAGNTTDALSVYVSIPPQRYFVQRIGGANVDVGVLLPPGQSPHTFEPAAKQMIELSKARVFFGIGVPFEKQVAKKIEAAFEHLVVVDTGLGIDRSSSHVSCNHEHGDTEGAAHEHGELDPHIWMNPRLVKSQARIICDELSRQDPARAEQYESNLASFTADLNRIDEQLRELLEPLRGRAFLVYHPAYGHFAEAYGLRQVAVETSGKPPAAKRMLELIRQAKADGIKSIFVQPQSSRTTSTTFARQIGAEVVVVDPLAEDYLDNLRGFASKIRDALGGPTAVSRVGQ